MEEMNGIKCPTAVYFKCYGIFPSPPGSAVPSRMSLSRFRRCGAGPAGSWFLRAGFMKGEGEEKPSLGAREQEEKPTPRA
jgi:hypothetical protein